MNISSIKTPGVYIDEKDAFPPSIANVATAIPAFVGFTEKAPQQNEPVKITSMLEYEQIFGGAPEPKNVTVVLDANNQPTDECKVTESDYKLYNSLRLFYANGGGVCYIVSIGLYGDKPAFDTATKDLFIAGLETLEKKDEPTLLLFPDAVSLSAADLGAVQVRALTQCSNLMDRFTIMDVKQTKVQNNAGNLDSDSGEFRTRVGNQFLKYGAAYYPYLQANFPSTFRFKDINEAIPNGFKTLYPNNADLKDKIDLFKNLYTDIITLKSSWTTILAANKKLDWVTLNAAELNSNLGKCWNLLKVFGNPTALTDKLKQYINEEVITLKLLSYTQDLVDFRKAYQKLSKSVADDSPVAALALVITDADYKGNWGTISTITESAPINRYDGALSNTIQATVAPDPIVPKHDIPDFTKIQVVLNKLHIQIMNAINQAFVSIEDFELINERNLILQIPLYSTIISKLSQKLNTVPPSGAIAGIYAQTDATRGVWKAPANVSINGILGLTDDLNDKDQQEMNIHETGKSINAIRKFTGRGTLVWGARTLDGNSNDWRYINVRRLANMIEEATKKACMQFVFEPNVAQTWINVKGMIENYLTTLWNDGALAGAKPEHAFFVAVGLNQTMSAQDILDGKMIVKIGYAPSRPAEFIILEFKQMQQKS
ncbi:phage tail sheath C-terminal domain-containing protein [Chryseobacterium gambrini]|uniref:Tail sheath protein C-terminal domain-containing protein n=1 Tax=Chryseobacterium gambrini TaxID=373672 RepID=A0A1N7L930_9FLAO|nr:phage tail sheath C-terminal domain-containing protein [Chryseobacterium gambrini]SIS70362.1 hypothetical protein SAMN05421785_10270 [Chryseobacterium gambrini]